MFGHDIENQNGEINNNGTSSTSQFLPTTSNKRKKSARLESEGKPRPSEEVIAATRSEIKRLRNDKPAFAKFTIENLKVLKRLHKNQWENQDGFSEQLFEKIQSLNEERLDYQQEVFNSLEIEFIQALLKALLNQNDYEELSTKLVSDKKITIRDVLNFILRHVSISNFTSTTGSVYGVLSYDSFQTKNNPLGKKSEPLAYTFGGADTVANIVQYDQVHKVALRRYWNYVKKFIIACRECKKDKSPFPIFALALDPNARSKYEEGKKLSPEARAMRGVTLTGEEKFEAFLTILKFIAVTGFKVFAIYEGTAIMPTLGLETSSELYHTRVVRLLLRGGEAILLEHGLHDFLQRLLTMPPVTTKSIVTAEYRKLRAVAQKLIERASSAAQDNPKANAECIVEKVYQNDSNINLFKEALTILNSSPSSFHNDIEKNNIENRHVVHDDTEPFINSHQSTAFATPLLEKIFHSTGFVFISTIVLLMLYVIADIGNYRATFEDSENFTFSQRIFSVLLDAFFGIFLAVDTAKHAHHLIRICKQRTPALLSLLAISSSILTTAALVDTAEKKVFKSTEHKNISEGQQPLFLSFVIIGGMFTNGKYLVEVILRLYFSWWLYCGKRETPTHQSAVIQEVFANYNERFFKDPDLVDTGVLDHEELIDLLLDIYNQQPDLFSPEIVDYFREQFPWGYDKNIKEILESLRKPTLPKKMLPDSTHDIIKQAIQYLKAQYKGKSPASLQKLEEININEASQNALLEHLISMYDDINHVEFLLPLQTFFREKQELQPFLSEQLSHLFYRRDPPSIEHNNVFEILQTIRNTSNHEIDFDKLALSKINTNNRNGPKRRWIELSGAFITFLTLEGCAYFAPNFMDTNNIILINVLQYGLSPLAVPIGFASINFFSNCVLGSNRVRDPLMDSPPTTITSNDLRDYSTRKSIEEVTGNKNKISTKKVYISALGLGLLATLTGFGAKYAAHFAFTYIFNLEEEDANTHSNQVGYFVASAATGVLAHAHAAGLRYRY